jgi:hypothetical protein
VLPFDWSALQTGRGLGRGLSLGLVVSPLVTKLIFLEIKSLGDDILSK